MSNSELPFAKRKITQSQDAVLFTQLKVHHAIKRLTYATTNYTPEITYYIIYLVTLVNRPF